MPKIFFRIDNNYDAVVGNGAEISPFNFGTLKTAIASYFVDVAGNFDFVFLGRRAEVSARTIADDFKNLINDSNDNRKISFLPED
jgi:predicted phosphodiesterase